MFEVEFFVWLVVAESFSFSEPPFHGTNVIPPPYFLLPDIVIFLIFTDSVTIIVQAHVYTYYISHGCYSTNNQYDTTH